MSPRFTPYRHKILRKRFRCRDLVVSQGCRRQNDVPDYAARAEARQEGWGVAPFVIDWGEELWFAGQGVQLPAADSRPVHTRVPNRRPRRVIIHLDTHIFVFGPGRPLVSACCALPGSARHLVATERRSKQFAGSLASASGVVNFIRQTARRISAPIDDIL